MAGNSNFLHDLVRGLGVAGAIGVGLSLSLIVTNLIAGSSPSEAGQLLFLRVFIIGFAVFGSAIIGAIVGLATGMHSSSRGRAALAAATAGIVGQFVILLLVFLTAMFIVTPNAGGSASSSSNSSPTPVDWAMFGKDLLFLVPAGVAAAITALVAAPSNPATNAQMGYAAPMASYAPPAESNYESPPTPGPMRRLACPRCKNTVMVGPGQKPACNSCGFGT